MRAAIYTISTGKIRQFVDVVASQLDIQCDDGEDFYLNIGLDEATHIINNNPVVIPVVRPPETLESKMTKIRMYRDALLRETDVRYCNPELWSDMLSEKQQQWRSYKQALRNFPAVCDPDNPVWPIPPI